MTTQEIKSIIHNLKSKGYTSIVQLENENNRGNKNYFRAFNSDRRKCFIKVKDGVDTLKEEYEILEFVWASSVSSYIYEIYEYFNIDNPEASVIVYELLDGKKIADNIYDVAVDQPDLADQISDFLFLETNIDSASDSINSKELLTLSEKLGEYFEKIKESQPDLYRYKVQAISLVKKNSPLFVQQGDFFNINLFWTNDNRLKVIDWEHASKSSKYTDIALLIAKNLYNKDFILNIVKQLDEKNFFTEMDEFKFVLSFYLVKEIKILLDIGDYLKKIPVLNNYFDFILQKIATYLENIHTKKNPKEIVELLFS